MKITLEINYETDFPHAILGWKETVDRGFGSKDNITTIAKRTNVLKSPYWQKNKKTDSSMRKELGLNGCN